MSKSAKKLKKPLDLPLGKATSHKDVDLSHVRLPIDTSVFGLKHVLTLFETATNEVKSYLAYECDLMYECRICRTIFRSIANFILHKRKFCRDKYNTPRDPRQSCQETDGVTIIQRDIENANQIITETEVPGIEKTSGSCLNPIIEKLLRRQEQKKFVDEIKHDNSVNLPKTEELRVEDLRSISLERIETSDVAMFQTLDFGPKVGETEMMKSEVMEIHSIFDQNEAVLGSNGEILSLNNKEKYNKQTLKNDFVCTECNTKFSTKKTLAYHIKCKHSHCRLVYPCPLCKDNLSNPWSVYRHLLKVHRMTSNQVRKYRIQVHNSAIFKKLQENKDRKSREPKGGNDQENEWLDNIEGDSDLQMCGGCGKHFERKAALISHSVMCTKRIAVCNSIKENNTKKKELDIKANEERLCKSQLKGSAKRKSSNIILYKPKTENSSNEEVDPNCNIPLKIKDEPENEEDDDVIPSFIIEDNDSDMENSAERIRKDIQMYDKDKLMSIIGVDTSADKETTPSEIYDKQSDRSDSPCRGFETQSSEYTEHVIIKNLENSTGLCDKHSKDVPDSTSDSEVVSINSENSDDKATKEINNDVDNHLDIRVVSKVPNNLECKITYADISEQSSNSSKCSKEMDISSDISLDNKISSDFKLDLGEDPNFQDVSIKSLIKEIIEEDVKNSDMNDPQQKERANRSSDVKIIPNGLVDQKIPEKNSVGEIHFINEEKLNNNNNAVITAIESSCSSKIKKRKRSSSPIQGEVKKKLIPNMSEESVNETEKENETFISKISPFVDRITLTCSLCACKFMSLSQLLLHMSNHFSWYRFQCGKCSFMSFNKCDCEKHVLTEHKMPLLCSRSVVLPIPTWKASLISDTFMQLESRSNDEENQTCILLDSNVVEQFNTSVNLEIESVNFEMKQLDVIDNSNDYDVKVLPENLVKVEVNEVDNLIDLEPESMNSKTDNDEVCTSVNVGTQLLNFEKTKAVVNTSNDLIIKLENHTTEENSNLNEKNIVDYVDLTIEENSVDNNEITENLSNEETEVIQDLSKQAIMEVILGNEHKKEKNLNKSLPSQSCEYVRPLRNRTKSIKTSQKDFIYDFDTPRSTFQKGCNSKSNIEQIKEYEVQE